MKYSIYAHVSKNFVGYFVEDDNGKVVYSGLTKSEYMGYTEPLLSAVIACVKVIPQGCPISIHSPIVSTIATHKGVKRALSLREEMMKLLRGREVEYIRANKDDEKIRRASSLIYCKRNELDFIPDYIVYTDGSCNNLSPYGEGGASYVILDGQKNIIKQNSKGFVGVTNNRMELMAILSAVAAIPEGSTLLVYTDSQYCIKVLTNKRNVNNQTRPNASVIRQYFKYASRLKSVKFEWVKGHNGNEFNEMADALAESRTEEMRVLHNIPVFNYKNSPKCRR